ncbi:unnamed protein product [Gordionus sp. m RMFG-2023]|uniref:BRCA1-associated protein-like n=1 Tax=Gordionus sp. m RMFG-2023 TaxID=3053472 RepID=UPI0030DFCA6F
MQHIYLTQIRFEISDIKDTELESLFKLLRFSTPDEQIFLDPSELKFPNKNFGLVDKFLGKRKYHNITIETIINPRSYNNTLGCRKETQISMDRENNGPQYNPQKFMCNGLSENNSHQDQFPSEGEWHTIKKKHANKSNKTELIGKLDNDSEKVYQDLNYKEEEPPTNQTNSYINFYYGNPSTHVIKGLLHIYKENVPRNIEKPNENTYPNPNIENNNDRKKLEYRDKLTTSPPLKIGEYARSNVDDNDKCISGIDKLDIADNRNHISQNTNDEPHRSLDMVCILSIPLRYTTHRFLKFLSPFLDSTIYIRILKDGSPNHYMALVKFRHPYDATEFYHAFNGVPFSNNINTHIILNNNNSTSVLNNRTHTPINDVCHVVFVSRIECESLENCSPFPPSGTTELPKCIVCMERMEESVEGVLTVFCNHSFHTQCLSQWKDSSCPVCRFSQTGNISTSLNDINDTSSFIRRSTLELNENSDDEVNERIEENECLEEGCESRADLWICLICGNVGCGRYLGGHASKHFELTQHTYSMELETGRVWDYTGDNYVHRLIQNKADGKMVEYVREGSTLLNGFLNASRTRTNESDEKGRKNKSRKKHKRLRKSKKSCHVNDDQHKYSVETEINASDTVEIKSCMCEILAIEDEDKPQEKETTPNVVDETPLCHMCGKFRYPPTQVHDDDDLGSSYTDDNSDYSDYFNYPDYNGDNPLRMGVVQDEMEKLDSVSLEYSYLMSRQLASQRAHFKDEIEKIESEYLSKMVVHRDELHAGSLQLADLTKKLALCEKEKEKLEKKYGVLGEKFEKLLKNYYEEKSINKSLAQNQELLKGELSRLENKMKESVESKDGEIRELQEQMRDIMFHFNAQSQISASELNSEIQEGTLIIPNEPPRDSLNKNAKNRRNKPKK